MDHMRLGLVACAAFAMAVVLAVLAIADQAKSGLTTVCGLAAMVFAVVGVRLLMVVRGDVDHRQSRKTRTPWPKSPS